jgi:hypothetical protein
VCRKLEDSTYALPCLAYVYPPYPSFMVGNRRLRQSPMPLDLQLLLRQALARVQDSCYWFYSRSCARPPRGQTNGHWFYSRSCARPPMGRTECHWVYGVKPLVLHRARPLKGLTTASGSTAAAAPGPHGGFKTTVNIPVNMPLCNAALAGNLPTSQGFVCDVWAWGHVLGSFTMR